MTLTDFNTFYNSLNDAWQILILIGLALVGHVIVYGVRFATHLREEIAEAMKTIGG